MGNVIYTPFDLSAPVRAGRRRFWKQVLPVTKINYRGQQVDFNPDFHMDLSQAFSKKAFDQVPVVFANADNAHNMDPRNFGGDVVKMEYRGPGKGQGTWALIEADRSAAKAIQRNPKLGVSLRIRQGVEKSDGRTFDRAVEHVCLTMNPRVTGMEPWQAVDLSDEDTDIEVVDLSTADYTEGTEMGKGTATKSRRRRTREVPQIDLSNLSDEDFQTLLDLAEASTLEREDEDLDEDEDDDDIEDIEPPRKTRRKKSRTKVVIDKESEDDGDEDDEDDDKEDEDEEVELTDSTKKRPRRKSSTVIKDNERSQFGQMRYDLAFSRWETERSALLDDGVPPFLLDLAEPILSLPDAVVIDLSDNEDPIDATATIRKMLEGVKGVVDLSDEDGHSFDLSDDADDETTALLDAWDKTYG